MFKVFQILFVLLSLSELYAHDKYQTYVNNFYITELINSENIDNEIFSWINLINKPLIEHVFVHGCKDLCIDKEKLFDLNNFDPTKVKDGDIIFIQKLGQVEPFLTKYHHKIHAKYFLTTMLNHGKKSIEQALHRWLKDEKLLACLGLNCFIPKHKKMIPLSLGTSWSSLVRYPKTEDVKSCLKQNFQKKQLVLSLFSRSTHIKRPLIYQYYQKQPYVKSFDIPTWHLKSHLPPHLFIKELATSYFNLSPRGFGVDCFRTWESFPLGSIPVVEKSPLDYLYYKLPVMIVDDMTKLNKTDFTNFYTNILNNVEDLFFQKTLTPYWTTFIEKLKAYARENRCVLEEISKFKKITYNID